MASKQNISCNLEPAHLVALPAHLVEKLLHELSQVAGAQLLDALESERSSLEVPALNGKRRAKDLSRLHGEVMDWMRRSAVHHGTMQRTGFSPHNEALLDERADYEVIVALREIKAIRNGLAIASMQLERTLIARGIDANASIGATE